MGEETVYQEETSTATDEDGTFKGKGKTLDDEIVPRGKGSNRDDICQGP